MYIYIYIYIYLCTYLYVYIYIYIYIYVNIHLYLSIHLLSNTCMHIIYVCIWVYIIYLFLSLYVNVRLFIRFINAHYIAQIFRSHFGSFFCASEEITKIYVRKQKKCMSNVCQKYISKICINFLIWSERLRKKREQ